LYHSFQRFEEEKASKTIVAQHKILSKSVDKTKESPTEETNMEVIIAGILVATAAAAAAKGMAPVLKPVPVRK
jgi:hypothetical protein